jgi:hypothetical protein
LTLAKSPKPSTSTSQFSITMSKYAFLIHGDEGQYEQINDRLRLRKYGAWLIAEKIQQDKLAKQQARQVLSAVQLAKRIADRENISVEEAFARLQNQGEADNALMLSDYLDEARDMVEGGLSRNESDAKVISIFMRTRGEGLIKGKWSGLGDWGDGDTELMDEELKDKVMAFINAEQMGGSKADELDDEDQELAEEPEDAEGKAPGIESKPSALPSSSTTTTGTAATEESPLVA